MKQTVMYIAIAAEPLTAAVVAVGGFVVAEAPVAAALPIVL